MPRYTRVAMVFHWVMAVAVLANIALPSAWSFMPDDAVRPAIDAHKSIGVTILGLAIMRVLWRLTHRPPPLPDAYGRLEKRTAHGVHRGLYGVMFLMPLTGWIMDSAYKDAAVHPMRWFGLFEWPRIAAILDMDLPVRAMVHDGFGLAHSYLAWIVYALLLAHLAGVIKHQWLDGGRPLQRIWPGGG